MRREAAGLSGIARAGLYDGLAGGAEGAGGRIVGSYGERGEGDAGDCDVGGAAAAVDDRGGGQDVGAEFAENGDDFAGGSASGDDILNDDGAFAGFDGEAAAEGHFAFGVAFGEDETGAEGAGDFVADDEPADGGRGDNRNGGGAGEGADLLTQRAAERFGVGGVLEDFGALEIFRAMETGSETEMTVQISAGLDENGEDRVGNRGWESVGGW